MLKDPRILILDEATSNLDEYAEKEIIKALKEITKGRTCIIVTHKIENYRDFVTRIVELKKISAEWRPCYIINVNCCIFC